MHIVGSGRVADGDGLFSWRRFLPYLAYFGIYKFAGFSPIAFHMLNLLIHLGMSALVLWSMRDFERFLSRETGDSGGAFSLMVALLFACHPLGSEPVNYARCTPILLVGMFSYLAAWATLRCYCFPERRGANIALVAVGVTGATFSKEPGLIHALGSVALVMWFCRGLSASKVTERRKFVIAGLVGGALVIVPAAILGKVAIDAIGKPEFLNHTLTQCRVFWMYVQRMILPVDLSVDHYVMWTNSWQDWSAIAGLIGILAVVGGALFRGRGHRLVRLAVVLAAFHLLLRMGYVIGHEMMVEYRTYPSLPWVAVAIASLLFWIGRKVTFKPVILRVCAVSIVLCLCLLSVARSTLWSKPSALARDALRQYPDNNRARAALMRQLLLLERFDLVAAEHSFVLASVGKMAALNQSDNAVRRYDPDRLIGDWTSAETSYAPALASLQGVEAAIAHLDRTIDTLGGNNEDVAFIDFTSALQDLIEIRERLREFDDHP